jgi:lipopolysaccharide/colanic/teichoic acid biosynthesis glycosyltransferase
LYERRKVATNVSPTAQRKAAIRKRALDLVIGSALTVLTAPLMLILAIGVSLSLRAWPLFSHWRIGHHGRPIRVYKLRTLPTWTPPYADKFALRIEELPLPWLCRLLRRTHIDELPQLWLVVTGKMSLVGPRPVQTPDIEPVPETFDALRSAVRPGCTGLWQISTASSGTATSVPEFDLHYIAHASLRYDAWILFRTVGWMLCLTKPVSIDAVPGWVLGPGLATNHIPRQINIAHRHQLFRLVSQHMPAADNEAYAAVGD